MALNEQVRRVSQDWSMHAGGGDCLDLRLCDGNPLVQFDEEHLRRVLVNLLDNARRYASQDSEAIVVSTASS
ncbi:MAG: PAS domain-containing sensor histidine kinase, partial [Planctomycetaceae bacterium]